MAALRLPTRHRVFATMVALSIVPRALITLTYRPAVLHHDSAIYLKLGNRLRPDVFRTDGYPFLLWTLRPFHSLALVITVQHLLGLAGGILIYAVLRRQGLSSLGATLAASPALFDGRAIWLEHSVLSEALFTCCVIAAVVTAQWSRALSVRAATMAGGLFALAVLVRPVAFPLLLLVAGYLVIRRTSPKAIGAFLFACLMPLAGYAMWFHGHYGRYTLSTSDGIFLWSRTMSFADCARIKPPPNLRPLCPDRRDSRPMRRLASLGNGWPWSFLADAKAPGEYLWDENSWLRTKPGAEFSPQNNDLARDFALRAIAAQPLDYALIVGRDVALTVYLLSSADSTFERPDTADPPTAAQASAYTRTQARLSIAQPLVPVLRGYMQRIYLNGLLYSVVLTIGLAGLIANRRRRGGIGLLPWTAALTLLILPCATVQPDPRYAMPSIPLACLAAALAFVPVRGRTSDPAPPEPLTILSARRPRRAARRVGMRPFRWQGRSL